MNDKVKTSSIAVECLKPCAVCGGKIVPIFRVVEIKHAVVNTRGVNATLGLAQYFGGSAAGFELAKQFTPDSEGAAVLEEPAATARLFICNDCFCTKEYNLAELAERDAEIEARRNRAAVEAVHGDAAGEASAGPQGVGTDRGEDLLEPEKRG